MKILYFDKTKDNSSPWREDYENNLLKGFEEIRGGLAVTDQEDIKVVKYSDLANVYKDVLDRYDFIAHYNQYDAIIVGHYKDLFDEDLLKSRTLKVSHSHSTAFQNIIPSNNMKEETELLLRDDFLFVTNSKHISDLIQKKTGVNVPVVGFPLNTKRNKFKDIQENTILISTSLRDDRSPMFVVIMASDLAEKMTGKYQVILSIQDNEKQREAYKRLDLDKIVKNTPLKIVFNSKSEFHIQARRSKYYVSYNLPENLSTTTIEAVLNGCIPIVPNFGDGGFADFINVMYEAYSQKSLINLINDYEEDSKRKMPKLMEIVNWQKLEKLCNYQSVAMAYYNAIKNKLNSKND